MPMPSKSLWKCAWGKSQRSPQSLNEYFWSRPKAEVGGKDCIELVYGCAEEGNAIGITYLY